MTIYAPATAPGQGAIAIVRISGEKAGETLTRIFRSKGKMEPNVMRYGTIVDGEEPIDEAMAVFFQNPHSYTREDMAELYCHGSMAIVERVLELLSRQEGLRLAQPGEFTRRAFLNGRMDLAQAEAVMSLIASQSELGRKASLRQLKGSLSQKIRGCRDGIADILAAIEVSIDYPEEEFDPIALSGRIEAEIEKLNRLLSTFRTGRLLQEGVRVAIVGRPNVGKSSLLNALIGSERAIVTEIPGTTRDVVEAMFRMEGLVFRFYDTAGIREADNPVERIGVERSLETLEDADLVLGVFDQSEPLTAEDEEMFAKLAGRPGLIVLNKSDKPASVTASALKDEFPGLEVLSISAREKEGLENLLQALYRLAAGMTAQSETVINERHREAISRAKRHLEDAAAACRDNWEEDCISIDVRAAWEALGEIVGETATEDLLDRIFSKFCLGK